MASGHDAPAVPADPLKFDAAIRAFRDRVPMTRKEWDKLDEDEQDFAFTVSGVNQANMVASVWDAVDAAVEDGETLDDFKARVADMLYDQWGEPDSARVETIFRTNVNEAYNDGREAFFRSPEVMEDRPIWRFEHVEDADECEICQECGGVMLPADDPWWDDHRPILHMRCRCSFTALTLEEARAEGYVSDDNGPAVEPQDGFGGDNEWDPGGSDYPSDIGDHLESVLDR
jgi:SPP1 gp7 family putative phage head morphogenesis protein